MRSVNKTNKIILLCSIIFLSILLLPTLYAVANTTQEGSSTQEKGSLHVDILVFVGQTCPHCAELEEYLDRLKEQDTSINPVYYEIWYNEENRKFFEETAESYGITAQGVPTYFIGNKTFVGYSPTMNQEILDAIHVMKNAHSPAENEGTESLKPTDNKEETNTANIIAIPFIGNIDAATLSLPVLTVILGFLDGFNPCAFFVLLFLLSMLVYAKSRKRMLIIGLTFVFFSGLVYFLFMAAWLSFFMITKNLTLITTIAGIIALIIAAINIKDFFAFKKGVTLSVSDEHSRNLMTRMRSLLKAESMVSMLIGTIALAIAANMYELLCTAGFPMVFTKVLVLNDLSMLSYYAYLVLYNTIYVLPLLTIVLVFTYSFGAKKLSQSQGEALKLLSGMMMLALGSILVFAPGLLNNVAAAVGIIALALTATGIILLARKLLQKQKKKENEDDEV